LNGDISNDLTDPNPVSKSRHFWSRMSQKHTQTQAQTYLQTYKLRHKLTI